MKIYYAHHLWKYDTKIEQYEINLVKDYFILNNKVNPIIINPNGGVNKNQTEKDIMKQCLGLVRDSEAVVFSSINEIVGRGVWSEVKEAISNNKEIYYIHKGGLIKLEKPSFRIINKGKDWRMFATVELEEKKLSILEQIKNRLKRGN